MGKREISKKLLRLLYEHLKGLEYLESEVA